MVVRSLRIFVSSPSDVAEERRRAGEIIAELQRTYGADRIRLEAILWEDLPLGLDAPFQQGIEAILSKAGGVDIAVFILWSRLGSPLPTSLRKADGSEYRSGTEREFELMVAANEASAGARPALLAYIRQDDRGLHKLLEDKSAAELEAVVDQLRDVRRFVASNFQDASGRNARAYHSYSDPGSFAKRLKTHLEQLIDEALAVDAPARWERPPYVGLGHFEIDDSAIFFGREQESYELESILLRREEAGDHAFVCIVGASGAGKSSLARAGLVARLVRGADSVRRRRSVTVMPRDDLERPARALCKALWASVPELAETGLAETDFCEGVLTSPDSTLRLTLGPLLKRLGVQLIVLVDQLEELFSELLDDQRRAELWKALRALSGSGLAWVVATLRSDFYARAQADSHFLELKGSAGHFDLVPPGAEALGNIIQRPARMAGLRFEQEGPASLSARILNDALVDPQALPMLEYALTELWLKRTAEGVLSFAAYEELGGVAGAIDRWATRVFAQLDPEAQASLERVLPQLVRLDHDGLVSARNASWSQFSTAPERALVAQFIKERLLIAQGATVRVSHEALLSRWSKAKAIIEVNRERLATLSRLEERTADWVRRGRAEDLLLGEGAVLEEAEALGLLWPESVAQGVGEYVEASRRVASRRRQEHYARESRLLARSALQVPPALAVSLAVQSLPGDERLSATPQSLAALGQVWKPPLQTLNHSVKAMVVQPQSLLLLCKGEVLELELESMRRLRQWSLPRSAVEVRVVQEATEFTTGVSRTTGGEPMEVLAARVSAADPSTIVLLDRTEGSTWRIDEAGELARQWQRGHSLANDVVAISPRGERYAYFTSGSLVVRKPLSYEQFVSEEPFGRPQRLEFLGEDRVMLVTEGGEVKVIDASTGAACGRWTPPRIEAVSVSSGGKIAVLHEHGVSIWDSVSATVVQDLLLGDDLTDELLSMSPDGATLVVTSASRTRLRVIDVESGLTIERYELADSAQSVAVTSSDRCRVAASSADGVLIWALPARELRLTGPRQKAEFAICLATEDTRETLLVGQAAGRTWEVRDAPLLVGRGSDCDILLDDRDSVSRRHCMIERSAAGLQVTDLGSTNGTFLNGTKLEAGPIFLRPRQRLRVGHYELFCVESRLPKCEPLERRRPVMARLAAGLEAEAAAAEGLARAWSTSESVMAIFVGDRGEIVPFLAGRRLAPGPVKVPARLHGETCLDFVISPRGASIAVLTGAPTAPVLTIFDARTGALRHESLAPGPEAQLYAVNDSGTCVVRVGGERRTLGGERFDENVVWLGQGLRVVSDWGLKVRRGAQVVFDLSGHGASLLDVSLDERWLVARNDDVVKVVDLEQREHRWSVAVHRKSQVSACFSDDSRILALAGGSSVTLWEPQTGRRLATVPAFPAYGCQFSRDGERLVVWCDRGLLELDVSSVRADPAGFIESARKKVAKQYDSSSPFTLPLEP